jgi:type IV pilus assembly protein PilV
MLIENIRARVSNRCDQSGFILADALIGILIFSIGILGLVGFQAATVRIASDSNYRTNASYLAEQLIGEMWGDDKNTATLQANYNSPAGAKYLAWKATVDAASSGLPGVAANPPTVSISASNEVTITIFWQSPGEIAPHRFIMTARVNPA